MPGQDGTLVAASDSSAADVTVGMERTGNTGVGLCDAVFVRETIADADITVGRCKPNGIITQVDKSGWAGQYGVGRSVGRLPLCGCTGTR